MLFEFIVGSGLQPLEDFCVGSFGLPVAARMRYGGEANLDAHVFTVIPKEVVREPGSIISDDSIRNQEPGDQIFHELAC